MPTVSVRISEEEKRRLLKDGTLSDTIRNAVKLYLDRKESDKLLAKLEELQRASPVRTSSSEIVRMIREDRAR
ncbi:MAG: hypothetical protein OK438_00320 [Thaumarchaeota archaeon]|nr:hypothetical protein [Nitrososphaerota archaeon]